MSQASPLELALLSVLGVLVGAYLQYFFGRSLEARKQLTLQKSQSYIDYFRSVGPWPHRSVLQAKSCRRPPMRRPASVFSARLRSCAGSRTSNGLERS